MKEKLTIAFLTSSDPNDRRSWSGIHYHMLRTLEQYFERVVPLGPIQMTDRRLRLINLRNVATYILTSKRYNIIHNKLSARYFAQVFKKKLKEAQYDVIFAPASSVEMAYLKTRIPIVYFSDTSFKQICGYYEFFSGLSKGSERESDRIQKKALDRSSVVIHSSDWATDFVVQNYGTDPKRSFTVKMGANIDETPPIELILPKLENKTTCNLLFMGVEWDRKGGPVAYETFLELLNQGMDVTLTICGCTPPAELVHPRSRVIPFLNKNDKNQYNFLLHILANTHFLILPTKADCAGIVFAEMSAFGIPSITTNTGGVGSMVENEVNGYMLPPGATAKEYAGLIKAVFEDEDKYKKLVHSSRAKYEHELNWDQWGKKVKSIILEHIIR